MVFPRFYPWSSPELTISVWLFKPRWVSRNTAVSSENLVNEPSAFQRSLGAGTMECVTPRRLAHKSTASICRDNVEASDARTVGGC